MRFSFYIKLTFLGVISFMIITFMKTNVMSRTEENTRKDPNIINIVHKKNEMKYILQWTQPTNIPFVHMGEGRSGFIDRKCPNTNCIVTHNETLLGDVTKFDVIAFAGPEVVAMYRAALPQNRSLHQKYVFASIESSHNYPLCSNRFDGFFNWTWTYKLESHVRWGYIVIRDTKNNIIGPNKVMNWMKWDAMDPVSDKIKNQLKNKKVAAAWFVSNCFSKSGRENFVRELQFELDRYNLKIDVFGNCGTKVCPRDIEAECNSMIAEHYFFYLAFENAFSEDYVTEKLLIGLQNNAIPIVYGGANYTRFMPERSYLNAREMGVTGLATKIRELVDNPAEYVEYFRWKKYYSYHRTIDSVETNEYCRFCDLLNNEELVQRKSVYKKLRTWWDPPEMC